MGWLKALWKLLLDEFFPNKIKGTVSSIQFAVALLTALGVFFKVNDLPKLFSLTDEQRFHAYIWTTFVTASVFLAATTVLLQRLLRRHEDLAAIAKERKADRELVDRSLLIQHRMAECVRKAALLREKFDVWVELEDIGSHLREYLAIRLGGRHFNITIKCIAPGAVEGERVLTAIYRDKEQHAVRKEQLTEPLAGNHIYNRFRDAPLEESKQIYIPDIQTSPCNQTLRGRAHLGGYNSLLAVPLKVPAVIGATQLTVSGLVGFLGLDSPDVGAFNPLFLGGSPAKPLEELNFLYGLADGVATILILCQHVAEATLVQSGE